MKRKLSLFPLITFIILIFLFSAACSKNMSKTETKTMQSDTGKNIKNENSSKKAETENSIANTNAESMSENNQTTASVVDEFVPDPPVTAENTSLPFVVGAPVVDKQVFDKTDSRVMEALNAYYSVFTNTMSFVFFDSWYYPDINKDVKNIEQLITFITPRTLRRFTIIDLDNDNLPEIAVSTGEYEDDFWIFKYHNGYVYVYERGIKGLSALKIDGTFKWMAGGAEANGTGCLLFAGNETSTYNIMKSDVNDPSNYTYYINYERVSEKKYQEAYEYQSNKPDAVWYEYTKENIQKIE